MAVVEGGILKEETLEGACWRGVAMENWGPLTPEKLERT